MIDVQMNRDIKKFSPKIFMGLTGRQIVYIGAGAVPGIAAFLYANALSPEDRTTLAILFAAPIWLCGFIKIYGNMYLDEFVANLLAGPLARPKRRLYVPEGPFDYLMEQEKNEKKKKEKPKRKSKTYECFVSRPKER